MKHWLGLLLTWVLAACQVAPQWLEAVEEPALTFKERQVDPRATRLRDQVAHWSLPAWSGLDRPTTIQDRWQLFQVTAPTWQGITLAPTARLVRDDRTARGEHVLFHVPASLTSVLADLHEQLARDNWHLLEHMASSDGHDPQWVYLAFWRSQLSFLPQQLFTTACALIHVEQAGLTSLALSTRCVELRHTAQVLGAPARVQTENWYVVDMGRLMTHVPSTWRFAEPYAQDVPCAAPEAFACLYQYSLEHNGDTFTLRLLASDRGTLPTTLHPYHVLDIAQSLAADSLPLLIQPVILRHGGQGIQLYSWMTNSPAPGHVVRSEIHFFQDQQYLVFEGTLTGTTAQVSDQAPVLSQILQQIEYGTVE